MPCRELQWCKCFVGLTVMYMQGGTYSDVYARWDLQCCICQVGLTVMYMPGRTYNVVCQGITVEVLPGIYTAITLDRCTRQSYC